jgi:two-component system, sensor histidine kinase PdtaS
MNAAGGERPAWMGPAPRGDLAAAKAEPVDDEPADFTAEHVALVVPPQDQEASRHLKRLVANWGMLADFGFADLLLYVGLPSHPGEARRFLVVNQIRPNTHQTLFVEDIVGRSMDEVQRPLIAEAMAIGAICEGTVDSVWLGEKLRVSAVPVKFRGRTVAVMAREAAVAPARPPGELADVYSEIFVRLARMVARGEFPFADEEVVATGGPRVGDGVILLDEHGRVSFASPNAVSALRRLGAGRRVVGETLTELGVETAATYRAFFNGRPAVEEVERADAIVVLRCIPLLADGVVDGAVVLMRDITEVRSRDRALVSKDATIKEIHHRVKNNLQTISSLLRLQGRRLTEPSAKAAIDESVRRIRSIALVHETLSREDGDEVDFIDVVRPLVRMVAEGLTSPERPVEFDIVGDGGKLPSPAATSLSVVTSELLQNVMDHAYPPGTLAPGSVGHVRIELAHDETSLRMDVVDDGVGPPDGTDPLASSSLGLTIVRGLIEELEGTIAITAAGAPNGPPAGARPRPGTRVQLELPVVLRVEPDAERPPPGGGRSVGL